MILFVDICELTWMPIFLSWLLPFLLGLGLGRMIWGPFKIRALDQEKELVKYKGRVNELNADYQNCQKARTQLEGEAAELRGKIKELESDKVSPAKAKPKSKGETQIIADSENDGTDPGLLVHFGALSDQNLQIIEGVGAKLETILKDNGINTWSDLASHTERDLNELLESIDAKFRIIDTSSWPLQASFAQQRKWQELMDVQRSFSIKSQDEQPHRTKVERFMKQAGILNPYKKDDLKAIEGIGPKIEKLLLDNNIKSWEDLANSSVDQLQEILDSAGDRYKLSNPMTWPTQAELAFRGAWKELEKLQYRLNKGE